MILAGGDGACHFEVLDGGSVDVAEGCEALIAIIVKCDSDGVAAAEEGAAEGLVVAVAHAIAHRSSNADVAGQLHVLAAEVDAVADKQGEDVPVGGAADGVGGVLGA